MESPIEKPSGEDSVAEFNRRDAMKAFAKYSASISGAAVVVMTAEDAVAQGHKSCYDPVKDKFKKCK